MTITYRKLAHIMVEILLWHVPNIFKLKFEMLSWYRGKMFSVTGSFCREITCYLWIPCTKCQLCRALMIQCPNNHLNKTLYGGWNRTPWCSCDVTSPTETHLVCCQHSTNIWYQYKASMHFEITMYQMVNMQNYLNFLTIATNCTNKCQNLILFGAKASLFWDI